MEPIDTVYVYYVQASQQHRMAVPVSSTGYFAMRISELTGPLDAQLVCGRHGMAFLTTFFMPGDSVSITADKDDFFETLRFTGRGAHTNNYLTQAQRRFDNNQEATPEFANASVAPPEYQKLVEARRQQQLDTLAAWNARQPLPTAFLRSRQLVLDFQRGLSLLRYAASQKRQTQKEPDLPAGYFDFLAALPLRDKYLLTSEKSLYQTLSHLIMEYCNVRLLPVGGRLPNTPGTAERLYAQATADFGETPARDYVVSYLLVEQLSLFAGTSQGQAPVLAVLPTFRARNRDSVAAQLLRTTLRRTAPLERGSPAPVISLRDVNGKTVALQDFKGKVVYLDFWYSTCAPCLAEAPAAKELKQKFLGQDVVFLYISVDMGEALWRRTIAKHALDGPNSVHLLDPEGWKAAKPFQVPGYPTYWVIGRDGRIWRGAAPRPSAGKETVAMLEQALAEKR
jgi:peroxiredoxin